MGNGSKISSNHDYPLLLNDALEFINIKKGTVSVQYVLQRVGEKVNYKWLERNFLNYIRMSPKKYILLQRFLNTYVDLTSSSSYNLIEIAFKHGHYDQNHFLKDLINTSAPLHRPIWTKIAKRLAEKSRDENFYLANDGYLYGIMS